MIIFLGCFRGERVRLWALTSAEQPIIRIDDQEFAPTGEVGEGEGDLRWLDLGGTDRLAARFGQLRIEGMTIAEARRSRLLITRDADLRPEGSLDAVEQVVFGIGRREAGRSTLSPSRGEVGRASPSRPSTPPAPAACPQARASASPCPARSPCRK